MVSSKPSELQNNALLVLLWVLAKHPPFKGLFF